MKQLDRSKRKVTKKKLLLGYMMQLQILIVIYIKHIDIIN